ncbi:MAG: lycopene cyclase domain-containing protein [Polyangiaceae bacterium]
MNDFLWLSCLFLAPGVVVYVARPDLRRMMRFSAVGSLPFAATERFFAGSYWSPPSLFGLIERIGFGIEDILFVVALALYMSTAYAFVFRRKLAAANPGEKRGTIVRASVIVGTALGVSLLLVALRVHILYGSFIAMTVVATVISFVRRDLAVAAPLGGLVSVLTYFLVCVVYALVRPGVFERVWHTERFVHRFVGGIPVEELMYGFLAGVVATIFYPYVARLRYVR